MRRKHKTDGNQAEIVTRLRTELIPVRVMSHLGDGIPDLIARRADGLYSWLEVKRTGEKLTKKESELLGWLPGHYEIVYGPEDALAKLGYSRPSAG